MAFDGVYYCYDLCRLSLYRVTSITDDLQKGEHLICNTHQAASYPHEEGAERASLPQEVMSVISLEISCFGHSPDILQAWGDNRTCMGGASVSDFVFLFSFSEWC
jgi:hypothetical protein